MSDSNDDDGVDDPGAQPADDTETQATDGSGDGSETAGTSEEVGDEGGDPGIWERLDGRAGGAALVAGYLLLLVVLYRDPGRGVEAATASPGALVLFAGLPVAGVAVGLYSAIEGPYSGLALFAAANYLAVTAVTVTLLLPGVGAAISLAGLVLFALAVAALLASLRAGWAYLQVDPPG